MNNKNIVVDLDYGKNNLARLGRGLLGMFFVAAKHAADATEKVVEKYK